ncbi:toxin-activating lysine-acyltransferase [Actibacterium sp. 188UL27-1]|uniref:toxin-activating lysine-acyltransferase n=1 Tax=Actibacterium sp. 188UL27-1 TaxID=2786961 RepID=UPI00195D7D52|nr:toxin-activating lysine-acyltransferase [Actibacterium sp. 188UL27-1]MBM7068700.1 toxin-activating lysine-acyltransferase [Actibacterium sp. 188UL27-1]
MTDIQEAPAPDLVNTVRLTQSFGELTMAVIQTPRYRFQSIADLQKLFLEPMIRNRVAVARKDDKIVGFAVWASVSDEVHTAIRDQIALKAFPVQLRPQDWTSGTTRWLLDVIAVDRNTATSVVDGLRQEIGGGDLNLHPMVVGLLDAKTAEDLINRQK